jgi:ATP-binding cassette subfamily F protein uup
MLGNYAGTVILISHDRDFLDRVVSAVMVPEGDGRWIEYAGGYTDMLAQRGADLAGKRVPVGRTATVAKAAPPARENKPAKRKLSFREKHALETLPTEIAALQGSIRALQERLGDANLYARDRLAFTQASEALAAAQSELAAAEEKWLHLEMLREEIEGS